MQRVSAAQVEPSSRRPANHEPATSRAYNSLRELSRMHLGQQSLVYNTTRVHLQTKTKKELSEPSREQR